VASLHGRWSPRLYASSYADHPGEQDWSLLLVAPDEEKRTRTRRRIGDPATDRDGAVAVALAPSAAAFGLGSASVVGAAGAVVCTN
jgi:hypothetical protein